MPTVGSKQISRPPRRAPRRAVLHDPVQALPVQINPPAQVCQPSPTGLIQRPSDLEFRQLAVADHGVVPGVDVPAQLKVLHHCFVSVRRGGRTAQTFDAGRVIDKGRVVMLGRVGGRAVDLAQVLHLVPRELPHHIHEGVEKWCRVGFHRNPVLRATDVEIKGRQDRR